MNSDGSISEIILEYALDAKVGFAAAVVIYCLYKMMLTVKNKKARSSDDPNDHVNMVYTADYDNYKLILVVRTDLKMTKGKIAAQCGHAAVAAYKAARKQPKILRAWDESGQAKIALKVDSENALKEVAKHAKAVGLLINIIHDAGHTQVAPGSKTVCAIGPGPALLVDKITGHLKLL